jgi:hypothetical protein
LEDKLINNSIRWNGYVLRMKKHKIPPKKGFKYETKGNRPMGRPRQEQDRNDVIQKEVRKKLWRRNCGKAGR